MEKNIKYAPVENAVTLVSSQSCALDSAGVGP